MNCCCCCWTPSTDKTSYCLGWFRGGKEQAQWGNVWHSEQNQPDNLGQKESDGCNLTETDRSWWGCVPSLLRDASNDFTKTTLPFPPSPFSPQQTKSGLIESCTAFCFLIPKSSEKRPRFQESPGAHAVLLGPLPL